MKSYLPNPDNIYGTMQDIQLQQEQQQSSGEETEEDNENPVVFNNAEQDDSFVEFDHVLYSISSWINKFKEIMPETYLIDLPAGIPELFTADINILDVTDSPQLTEFCVQLEIAIDRVGGTAFIKNNWHAPKDASMFSLNHLLKVTNSRDALSYMMYSDVMMKDFDKGLGNMPFCVSVRPWMDIHPASEFRCLVVHKELVGITPREWPKYYAHYKDIMPTLIETVTAMFQGYVKPDFHADSYVFDVIYTTPHNCMLWDFSPLNESTSLYAFMWEEIKSLIEAPTQSRPPVFRYLAEDCGIMPSNLAYHQQY